MEEFKVLVSAELNTASIDNLKQQISGIKTNPVKIEIDTSDITSQIDKIKKQIEGLSGIKINLTGGTNNNETSNISNTILAYKELIKTIKEIGSIKTKLVNLDVTKDAAQITTLTNQLSTLQVKYDNIRQSFNQKFHVGQLVGLEEELKRVSNNVDIVNAKMSDTSALKAYKELIKISQQISKTELKIGSLKGIGGHNNEVIELGNQLNNLRNTYQQLATSMQGNLSTDQLRILSQQAFDTADKFNVLNAKIQDTKQKLASNIKLKIDNGTLDNQVSALESKFKKLGIESRDVSSQIQKMKSLLGNIDASDDIESVIRDYEKFQQVLKTTENKVKGLQRVQSEQTVTVNKTANSFSNLAKQVASYFSAYQMINYSIRAMKDMCQNVLNVDTAMTELYRITDLTSQQYDTLYSKMTSSAKEYGSSLAEIITSTADWVRLGFDSNSAVRLSEITTMYQHVTDLDNKTAVDNLVTAYKGFQDQLLSLTNNDESAAVELIADIYDKIGNEFALSAADVGSGLSKTASALQMAGNTIQESAA